MRTVICAIAKNENDYINEWVDYHLSLGFDHIYLYDNNDSSTPFVCDFIKQSSKVNILSVNDVHTEKLQIKCYDSFYEKYKDTFDWCAFIDIDEFIVLPGVNNIKKVLQKDIFTKFNAVRLNWHMYDDNNLVVRDKKVPVIKAFTNRVNIPELDQSKMILRGKLSNIQIVSCHYALQNNDLVKECLLNGQETFDKIFSKDHCDLGYINHYMTKTVDEFIDQKLFRGDACFSLRKLDFEYFWKINQKTDEKLNYIQAKLSKIIKYYSPATKTVDNVGDIFTKYLLQWMGHTSVYSCNPDIIGAGSILGFPAIKNKKLKVWGSGFLNEDDISFSTNSINFFAVRGKLTAKKLNLKNITIGDPGILASHFYTPKVTKKYKFGIITHFTDYEYIKSIAGEDFPYPIINTFIPNNEQSVKEFFNKINECEFIFSSSLHGIIFSHSYGIPAIHIKNLNNKHVNNKNVISQNYFKFRDYYSGLNIPYKNETFTTDLNFIEKYTDIDEYDYLPVNLLEMQRRLLTAFNNAVNFQEKNGYYTFLSTDNYTPLVLGLYKNLLDAESKYPLYCGVTKNITSETINILQKVGIKTFYVDTIDVEKSGILNRAKEINLKQKWLNALTKLALFKNTNNLDKIIYLDADLQIKDNIDFLFDKPHMSAVEDKAGIITHSKYEVGDSIFCSGLLVLDIKNNPDLYNIILNTINNLDSKIIWHDQNILNYMYNDWLFKEELHLDPVYGAMCFSSNKLIFEKSTKIIHFVTSEKTKLPFNEPAYIEEKTFDITYNYFKQINNTILFFNSKYQLNIPQINLNNIVKLIKNSNKNISVNGRANTYLYF